MQRCDEALVLEVKPYKETSALVNFFTRQAGVVRCLVRNVYAKSAASQELRTALQTARLVEILYRPSSGLQTVYRVDLLFSPERIDTKNYVILSYLNELLVKLLPQGAACEELFEPYELIIRNLAEDSIDEAVLRQFEYVLLHELGFDFDWYSTFDSEEDIKPRSYYELVSDKGFREVKKDNQVTISGENILSIAGNCYEKPEVQVVAKKIFRRLIQQHLSGRELKSRAMYLQLFSG